jgi:hypothetical protein
VTYIAIPQDLQAPSRTAVDARAFIERETNAHGKLSQRGRILKLLLDANGREVPLPEILALGIAQYGARILEARRAGFQIDNKTQWISGVCHSWFCLVLTLPKPVQSEMFEAVRQ